MIRILFYDLILICCDNQRCQFCHCTHFLLIPRCFSLLTFMILLIISFDKGLWEKWQCFNPHLWRMWKCRQIALLSSSVESFRFLIVFLSGKIRLNLFSLSWSEFPSKNNCGLLLIIFALFSSLPDFLSSLPSLAFLLELLFDVGLLTSTERRTGAKVRPLSTDSMKWEKSGG